MKKVLLSTVMSLMMCMVMFAQEYKFPPKENEKVLGTISLVTTPEKDGTSDLSCYILLLNKAQTEYPKKLVDIREMQRTSHRKYVNGESNQYDKKGRLIGPDHGYNVYWYELVAKVVYTPDPNAQIVENFSAAIEKAFRNVRVGSRTAIDQIIVNNENNKEEIKDQLIDVLLEKGYKVVAKEYLQRLYEEQLNQQSGIYNDQTTVQDNNFSAVGYYINVKITETSLRVQVINVSTGEYEGNATVNF